jgi:hypothetical protein
MMAFAVFEQPKYCGAEFPVARRSLSWLERGGKHALRVPVFQRQTRQHRCCDQPGLSPIGRGCGPPVFTGHDRTASRGRHSGRRCKSRLPQAPVRHGNSLIWSSTNASSSTCRAVAVEFPGYSTKMAARGRFSWPATTPAVFTCAMHAFHMNRWAPRSISADLRHGLGKSLQGFFMLSADTIVQ